MNWWNRASSLVAGGVGRRLGCLLAVLLLGTLAAAPAQARTIILDASEWDRVAGIDETGSEQSLALYSYGQSFTTTHMNLSVGRGFLFRFPLEKIPDGHRVVHAELVVPVGALSGAEPRFYLWRMLASWGPGVCWDYRQTLPEPIAWTKPGARGIAADHATRPTDVPRPTAPGEMVINVTEDVELWTTGSASNEGWMITVEDPGVVVQFDSPLWAAAASWRLRVTYEPEPAEEQP